MNALPRSKRIVVAYDFSDLATRVLGQALELSVGPSSELHVVSVGTALGDRLQLPEQSATNEAEASELLRARVAMDVEDYVALRGPLAIERIAVYATSGDVARQIVGLANEVDADLVVVGTHNPSGIERLLLGSVAEAVTKEAPCTVMVIRPRDFLNGQKLPSIPPAPLPGEPTLPHFRPRAVYHYTSRLQQEPQRVIPLG